MTFDDKNKKRKSYAEHLAEKEGSFTWKDIIRADIDVAAGRVSCIDDFYLEMEKMGYQIRTGNSEKYGKYIAYTVSGADKARRDYRLGAGYRINDIEEKIKSKEKPQERVFCRVKLPIVKGVSVYQKCMTLRITQAAGYHFYILSEKEQARVRKDLIQINRLQKECQYLISHDIQTREDIEKNLGRVKKDLKAAQNADYSSKAVTNVFSEEERKIVTEYKRKTEILRKESGNMTDEEFENLSDDIEEMEQKYGELLFTEPQRNIQNQDKINQLREERRLLLRLRREMEETLQVKEAARRIQLSKEISEEKEEEKKL